MSKFPVKTLSSAAIAALLLTPVAPYAAEAATPKAAEAPSNGIYVAFADGTKLFFTIEEVFTSEEAVDAINAAGLANVSIVQDGEVVNLDASFAGEDFSDYEDGDVPHGDYVGSDGSSQNVGDEATEDEFKVIDISSIEKTGVTVSFPSLEQGLTGVEVEAIDPSGNVVPVNALDIEEGAVEATFTFVEALESVEAGSWTVDGVTYLVGEDGEFVVETVEALGGTVDKNDTLKFKVNGQETTVDSLTAKGYQVEFKANKAVFEENSDKSSTGKLDNAAAGKFNLEIEVTKDGKTVAKAERVVIEVEDQENIIVAIKDIEAKLSTGQDITAEALQLALDDSVNISATTVSKNGVESGDITVTTNRPAVLGVSGTTVTPKNKGEATLTITAGDVTETFTVKVGDKRAVSKADSTREIAKTLLATGEETKATVVLKDQYGVAVTGATVEAVNADVLADGAATLVEDAEAAGTYTATLKAVEALAEDKKEVKGDVAFTVNGDSEVLDSIGLTVEAPGEIDYYELSADNAQLDLKEGATQSAILTLKAYDAKGLLVKTIAIDGDAYKLKSSNEEVVKVNPENPTEVVAVSLGTAEITVYEKDGALDNKIEATFAVEVVNSTPTLNSDEITFTSTSVKATEEGSKLDLSAIINATATSSQGEVPVTYTVAAGDIHIVEADKEGTPLNHIVLGKVLLSSSDKVTVEYRNDGVYLTSVEGFEDSVKLNIAIVDTENNFLVDYDIDVEYYIEEEEEDGE